MGLFMGFQILGDEDGPAQSNGNAAHSPPSASAAALTVQAAAEEIQAQLAERTRQLEAERSKAQQAFNELLRLAADLCIEAFDAELKRRGEGRALKWTPAELRDFIVRHARPKLDAASHAGDADLAAEHQALREAHAQLQAEHNRLKVIAEQDSKELAALRPLMAERERELTSLRDTLHARAATVSAKPSAPTPPPSAAVSAPVSASVVSAPTEPPFDASSALSAGFAQGRPALPMADPPDALPRADPGRVDELVRLVAATGLARVNRIRGRLATAWGLDAKSGSVRNVINTAIAQKLFSMYEIKADWQGAASLFVELTATGRERATALGVPPVLSEIAPGLQRGLKPEHVHLILRAVEVLQTEGCQSVQMFPGRVLLPDGLEYHPTLSATGPDGREIYVECERETATADRSTRWQLAALAGGGVVHLMTTSQPTQEALVSEINLAKTTKPFRLLACNISEYMKKRRGRDGSLWIYQN
jgi:hypothetical protein